MRIDDFAKSNSDRPLVRPVTLAELAGIEPATLFVSPVWLKVYGVEDLLAVTPARPNGADVTLLFAVRDRRLVHLGRLLRFEAACIEYLANLVLAEAGVDLVVFEDVEVDGALHRPGRSAFRYQRNWQIILNGPDAAHHVGSRSSRVALRKAQRAMDRDVPGVRLAVEEHPSAALVETIVGFNRTKIESRNRRHGIDELELHRLCAVAAEIGQLVTIGDDTRVMAGLVVCVAGRRAYGMVVGYDMQLSRFGPGIMVYDFAIEEARRRGVLDFNMLWGDGAYKQRLGGKPRELATLVVRRSPVVRFTPAYGRTVRPYQWLDFKARVKPLIRRRAAP